MSRSFRAALARSARPDVSTERPACGPPPRSCTSHPSRVRHGQTPSIVRAAPHPGSSNWHDCVLALYALVLATSKTDATAVAQPHTRRSYQELSNDLWPRRFARLSLHAREVPSGSSFLTDGDVQPAVTVERYVLNSANVEMSASRRHQIH